MAAPTITPAYLRTQLETLIDDTHDITHTYQLLTQAKNDLEIKLKLAILEASDSSQSANAGDTYLTLKSLPTDFRSMTKLYVGDYEFFPVAFNQRIRYRNAARRYYIDYKKMVQGSACLGLMGAVGGTQTLDMFYQVSTPALTEENEDEAGVVLWPDEFQPLIPYHVGKIIQANMDADEINFRMSEEQELEYQTLLAGFIGWDHDLKLAAMNGRLGYDPSEQDSEGDIDIGLL